MPDVLNTKSLRRDHHGRKRRRIRNRARKSAKNEGILVGISCRRSSPGAAIELAKRPENKGKNIVALLPDTGDRYYSTPLFGE